MVNSRLSVLVSLSLGVACGIFAFAAGAALIESRLAAILIAMLAGGLVVLLGLKRPIVALDATACSRPLAIISGLVTLLALVQIARLAVFMVDPSQVAYSSIPSSRWEIQHSCLSAYFVSAQAASTSPDIYDDALFTMPDDDPNTPRKARMIGPFKIDVFEYPPPFLLLPRALMHLTPDFMRLRMLWFGLSGGVFLFALLVVARFMSPAAGTRALLLSPLVWMSLPMTSTLQKGNVQGMVIAAVILAMALFEWRRWAAGGAILAFVTLSKLYPGLLVLYLLVRRQWRALAWTAAFAVVFLVLTFLDIGWGPYAAFLDRFPALLGGEAFPAFRNPAAMAINFSIPGLAFKAKLFGVPGMSFGASKIVGWIYTSIALAVTVLAGLRNLRRDEKPLVWMAILILATLRSPFLPQAYAAVPSLWLLTLLAATYAPTTRTLYAVILTWVTLNIYWPMDWPIDPRLLAVLSGAPQALTAVLVVLALRRRLQLETITP
ncbi:MAG: hypothetical protein AUI47_03640 [Acidobacteria bacterium 13_1_40CM_2_68_5]|nr:MAG: hypothetical protein AUI47_03640 [Acidobacteria bacterium 13_1_40CM_2_68_5]